MSQAGSIGNGGSGGSGITTINGDSGSITGSSVTIYANNVANNSGSSVKFVNSGTISTLDLTDILGNTMIGFESGNLSGSFEQCVALGQAAGLSLTSGENHVLIGYGAGDTIQNGNRDIIIGFQAGQSYKSSESNNICVSHSGITGESNVTRIGTQGSSDGQQNRCFIAGIVGVTSSNPEMVTINSSTGQLGVASVPTSGITTINGDSGSITGSTVTIYADNVANNCGSSIKFVNSGTTSTLNVTDSSNNVFLGMLSGNASMSGANNSGQGRLVLASATSADSNCGMGSTCLTSLTSGVRNCAMGVVSLQNLISGIGCTALGYSAGQNYTGSESNNICIGSLVTGTLGESNVTRIGNSSTTSCFITGISGVTVTGTAVLCSTSGQLGTIASSIRYKENVKDLPDLNIIEKLRPVNFNYKVDKIKKNEFGLIAEEVAEICPDLVLFNEKGEPETVFYQYLPILLLQEVQKLNKKIEKLELILQDK